MNYSRGFLKLFFLIAAVQLSFQTVHSQAPKKLRSTISISGSSSTIIYQDQQFFVQQSTGQSSVIGLSRGRNYLLRQGFIQPFQGSGSRIESQNLQVMISPNPFPADIIISFTEKISDDIYVAIIDLSGRTVYFKRYGATREINLNPGPLPAALYFIRVYTDKKCYISKLIKE